MADHSVTNFEYNIEVRYDETLLNLVGLEKRLQSALLIAAVANKHFDRGEAVDLAITANFIDVVMPSVKPITEIEFAGIEKCKTDLNLGEGKENWRRMAGTLNDPVQKFKSTTKAGELVTVKGVAVVDERAEVILS